MDTSHLNKKEVDYLNQLGGFYGNISQNIHAASDLNTLVQYLNQQISTLQNQYLPLASSTT
ncbi:hypothetical protein [Paenibacillus sp. 1-18]|uniref:hypothetical protein n=1 Tax=Paenibacillus sp. 1-18 TaxID=1333846 RepID=UPI0004729762|nr:hypothetical protein [Paenibacillus sp. 1-18]